MFKSCLFAICLLASSVCANGAIIVQVQNATITVGGSGFVDVMISSTGADNLAAYSYEFQIVGSQLNGRVEFQDASNQLSANALGSSYVFDQDSSGIVYSNVDPTTIQAFDGTVSLNNVALGGSPYLLAHLAIQHVSSDPLSAINDTFSVILTNIGGLTSFIDNNGQPLDYANGSDPVAFLNAGTITFNSTAVPEPGTLGALSLAAVAYFGRRWRNGRRELLAE